MDNQKIVFNAVTMIRGEDDIAWSSLYHHACLGFDRIIIISHVEHSFMRKCVDKLREEFKDVEVNLVEIEDRKNFSTLKGNYVNYSIAAILNPREINIVYCFDADEFLFLGNFNNIKLFVHEYLSKFDGDFLKRDKTPTLFKMPWIDLIPIDNKNIKNNDFTAQFLNKSYYSLEDSAAKEAKVIFRYSPKVWVHMGYHWMIDRKTKEQVKPLEAAQDFLRKNNICVYHIPIRSLEQFKNRLFVYGESALESAKYNVLSQLSEQLNEKDFIERFFGFCVQEKPAYDSWAMVKSEFGKAIDISKLKKLTNFLYTKRVNVGEVLKINYEKKI